MKPKNNELQISIPAIAVVVVILFIFFISALSFFAFDNGGLRLMLAFHESELTQYSENYLSGVVEPENSSIARWIDLITRRVFVDNIDGKSEVIFETGGSGLGPSTSYSGFYYSPDDLFISCLKSANTVLVYKTGDSAYWREESGDNDCYVRRIKAHWYVWTADF